MTLPPAGEACRAFVKCGCTKGCRGRGRCFKENLSCTLLCKWGVVNARDLDKILYFILYLLYNCVLITFQNHFSKNFGDFPL